MGTVGRNEGGPPSAPTIPKGRTVGINTTAVFAVTVVTQVIGYASTLLLARGVGATDDGKSLWGLIQFYLIISSSLNMLGELRLSSAYVYLIARGESPGTIAKTFLVTRTLLVAGSGAVLILLAIVLPSLRLISPPLSTLQLVPPSSLSNPTQLLEIFAVFMGLPLLWSIQTLYSQTVIAQGDSLRGQIPILVESVVRTAGLAIVALPFLGHSLAVDSQPSRLLWGMAAAYLLGAWSSAAYCLPQVVRYRGTYQSDQLRRMIRYAWPLMGSLGLLYLSNSTMPLIVYGYVGPAFVNIFNAANGFRILALALPAALAVPLFPHLSGLHSQKEYELVRDRTWRSLRFTAMLVVPGVVAMVVYRVPLLNVLYHGSYTPAGQVPLAILAVSAIPSALSQIIGTSLNAIGRQRLELYLTSLQAAVLFGTVGLLFPPLSFFGTVRVAVLTAASIAILGSSIAALGLNAFFVHRLMALNIQLRPIATILLSAAASFESVALLNRFVSVWHWYTLVGAFVLGFVVYTLVLMLVGELSREDVRQLGGSIGLPKRLIEAVARLCWRESSPGVNPLPPSGARAFRPTPPGEIPVGPLGDVKEPPTM